MHYAVLYRMPGRDAYQTALARDVWGAQALSAHFAAMGAKTRVIWL